MIDIKELLVLEETLRKEGENITFDFEYDEFSYTAKEQIIKKHISSYDNMTEENLLLFNSHNLSKEEAFILIVFTGHGSTSMNRSLSNREPKLDELQRIITNHFDNILSKIKQADSCVVYRMDKYAKPFKENALNWFSTYQGKIIKIPFFLSTSIEPWRDDSPLIWEIKLLAQNHTMAHKIFDLVGNHGNEKEVRFERNVKFYVRDIKKRAEKIWIYLEEVEPDMKEYATLTNCDYWDKDES